MTVISKVWMDLRCAVAVVGVVLVVASGARAEVAATGTFGIDISVSGFPPTSGTFNGMITGFDGPFMVGGTPVDLQSAIGTMSILTGVIPTINVPALAVTFEFDAADNGATANTLGFHAAGLAKCDNAIACAQGFGTFVADVTSQSDPNALLPDGYAYTFDGTVGVDGTGTFDAAGTFGLNAFSPVAAGVGSAVQVTSDPTTYYDSRKNTLRDFLVDLTFSEVTAPGTVTFLGKTVIPGILPAEITPQPDVSIFVDIVTGDGFAFTPPVDVCIAYDDVDPPDGIVDGTDVAVDTLRVLHALALGDNFQDVTTFAGGGRVCGQVDQLSPFLLAVGPPPPTTTTTSTTIVTFTTTTTSTSTTTTTTSTLPGGLVPGGPTKKSSSDCYLELVVVGIENTPPQVEDGKKIFCTDGDPCDLGPCGDNVCNMRAGACINQVDPNLPDCTPPAGLDKATIKNKVTIAVPQLLEGARCGELVDFAIEAKFNGKGKYQAKKSKQSLKGKAKAPKGTKPRSDSDKWTIYCQPRTTACPGSPSGAFVDDDGRGGPSSPG